MSSLTSSGITLGILGGGQLGRMSALAAARLGIDVVIYTPEENSPASQVVKNTIVAAYDDRVALEKFSAASDFISYEFENIPIETITYLQSLKKNSVFPDENLLDVSQDRIKEKTFLNDLEIETTQWAEIANIEDIKDHIKKWQSDGFIIKTARFGYDGKGQIKCDVDSYLEDNSLKSFFSDHENDVLILENLIDFSCEISTIVARDCDGVTAIYGPMLNDHKDHILNSTIIPSALPEHIEDKILYVSKKVADSVKLTGALTVEFFVDENEEILVNEIAPRTHNSGHWTIDACAVSQFENHVRTVCGLSVGSSARHSDAVMLNLIGDDIDSVTEHLHAANTCVHLYGKKETRVGRKMGHINFLKPLSTG